MALAASQFAFDWLPRFKRTRILLHLDDGVGTSAALRERPGRRRRGSRQGFHEQEQTEQESETVMSGLRAKPEWRRVTYDGVVHSVSYMSARLCCTNLSEELRMRLRGKLFLPWERNPLTASATGASITPRSNNGKVAPSGSVPKRPPIGRPRVIGLIELNLRRNFDSYGAKLLTINEERT